MTALLAIAARLAAVPWQVWAVAALAAAIGLYGCQQHRDGQASARLEIQTQQRRAEDAARHEVDRLRGGADRSRVQHFDRD
jgi:hypothetical protein